MGVRVEPGTGGQVRWRLEPRTLESQPLEPSTVTLVALMTAVATEPTSRPSSSTASVEMRETTRKGPDCELYLTHRRDRKPTLVHEAGEVVPRRPPPGAPVKGIEPLLLRVLLRQGSPATRRPP